MPSLVISTVGTSLLTNEINERKDPNSWLKDLTQTANWTKEKIENDSDYSHVWSKIIIPLKSRVENKLNGSNVSEIRKMSAELNGIYGLYEEQLSKGSQDIHFLIATDTAQGQITADIVKNFLRNKQINIDIFTPKGFSTESDEVFSNGIDEMLNWFDGIIPGYKNSGYEVYFNLVGGFKAIQGFVNTIGMFYADKIIYVFEGNRKIITIPRLPITINHSVIKPVEFALMAAAENSLSINISKLEKVPESLLYICDDEATLSNWGKLTWNNCKFNLFTKELLQFPGLIYDNSFAKDYERRTVKDTNKDELHTALAEISATMLNSNGDTSRILPKFKYRRYEGGQKCEGGLRKNEIDHFYLKDDAWRVSCVPAEIDDPERGKIKGLRMRHFGEHDYVNDNP